ncbi:MAG: beta-ketoacyl-ACP reductase, partial [Deltaproteobacteria bacterium]
MGEIMQRTVVITGGSRGIGRSVALKFAEEKASIVLVHYDPDESAAEETLELLNAKGVKAEAHKVDVSAYGPVEEFFREVLDKFGKVDVLINNAGITRDTLLMRMEEKDWDAVINVNLKSVFNCTHAVIRQMIKQRSGCIVNVSS